MQQLGDGAGRALRAVLQRPGAADPEEVVDVRGGLDVLADDGHVEGEVLGPVQTHPRGHAPRVAVLLEVLEQPAELGREGRLDEHLVAAQLDDRVDVLDVDGALLDARAARRARPQHVLVDDGVGAVRVVAPSGDATSYPVGPTRARSSEAAARTVSGSPPRDSSAASSHGDFS